MLPFVLVAGLPACFPLKEKVSVLTQLHTDLKGITERLQHIRMPGMLSTGICRTPSLKQVSPG